MLSEKEEEGGANNKNYTTTMNKAHKGGLRVMNCSTCRIRAEQLTPGHSNCKQCISSPKNNYPGYSCDTCYETKEICEKCYGIRKNHYTNTHSYTPKVCPDCRKRKKK